MARSYSSATSTDVPSHAASENVGLDANAQFAPSSAARPILRPPRPTRSPLPKPHAPPGAVIRVGRYEFAECIAKGGMATVHFARLHGDFDFSRIVAVKRLLPEFASDEQFKAMFVEEARLAARIRHPNVVSTLDVVADRNEVILVMDYVHGDSLSSLCKQLRARSEPIAPLAVTSAILSDVLRGLAFAHATTDKDGKPLNIVHCDVSPQNILVGVDGVTRVLDFGIAKANNSLSRADDGIVRGKPGYVAPEQLNGASATPQSDIFAVGVILWEMATGQRLFGGGFKASLARRHHEPIRAPSAINPLVNAQLDAVVVQALQNDANRRFRDAAEMMRALELACPPARPAQVAEWVEGLAADTLVIRGQMLTQLESEARRPTVPPQPSHTSADWLIAEDLRTDTVSTARSLHGTTPPQGAFRRKPARLVAALGVSMAAFVVGGVLSRTGGGLPGEVDRPAVAASTLNAQMIVAPVVTAVVTAAARDIVSPTSISSKPEPSPGAKTAASANAEAQPPPVDPKTHARAAPSGVVSGAKPTRPPGSRPASCSPPYTIDAAGRKHFRAECFR